MCVKSFKFLKLFSLPCRKYKNIIFVYLLLLSIEKITKMCKKDTKITEHELVEFYKY